MDPRESEGASGKPLSAVRLSPHFPRFREGSCGSRPTMNTIKNCNVEFDSAVLGSRRTNPFDKPLPVKYRRFTGRRFVPNTAKVIEIAEETARSPNRRITGPKNRKNKAMNRWPLLFQMSAFPIPAIGQRVQQPSRPLLRPCAPETQSAPEAIRTRECHSALNAMRHSRRGRKRNSIYPR